MASNDLCVEIVIRRFSGRAGQIWQNLGSGRGGEFSDFSDFPQMENRDLGWTGIGLGSPKTLFSAKKPWFFGYFWPFPIIWGFPLGCPPVSYGPLWATLRFEWVDGCNDGRSWMQGRMDGRTDGWMGTGATKIKKNRGGPPRGNPQIMGNGQK